MKELTEKIVKKINQGCFWWIAWELWWKKVENILIRIRKELPLWKMICIMIEI